MACRLLYRYHVLHRQCGVSSACIFLFLILFCSIKIWPFRPNFPKNPGAGPPDPPLTISPHQYQTASYASGVYVHCCSMKSSRVTEVRARCCVAIDLHTLGCEMVQCANLSDATGFYLEGLQRVWKRASNHAYSRQCSFN